MTSTRTIIIPPDRIKPCWEGDDFQKVDARFRVDAPGCHGSYSLTFSPEGSAHRKVYQGPMVSDLFGDMSPESVMIAAEPIEDPRPVITVTVGDEIDLGDYGSFTVGEPTRVNRDRPTLVAHPPRSFAEAYADWQLEESDEPELELDAYGGRLHPNNEPQP